MREAHVTIDDTAFDTIGIEGLVSLFRTADIRDFEELVCQGDGAVIEVGVETRVDEDQLDAMDCVDRWEYLSGSGEGHRYLVSFTAPELPEELGDVMDDLVATCDPELSEDETTMSFVGPQDAISETIRTYESAGVTPVLERLGSYDGPAQPLDDLTERQRQVLRTAYDMGYYEVPREVTTDDVAANLDVDASTVTEHLQRAERNLLANHL
jgi:hypothetical protein